MTPHITGTTRLLVVLGDPVAQVRAPSLVNPLLARLGVDAVLVPVHAPAGRLGTIVRGLRALGNLDGMLVTVPHKIAICAYADELSPAARLAGCVNALRREPDGRWRGDNFDGAGFVRGLSAAGHDPAGRRVLLVGAGGAGRAVAVALLEAGAARLTVRDVDVGRRAELVERLRAVWPDRIEAAPDGGHVVGERPGGGHVDADIAVNATPLGMRPDDPLPLRPGSLRPGTVVADVIMRPRRTSLLAAAAAAGHPVHHGGHMLDHQLDLYRRFFRLDERKADT
ncbi:shikimate dehydrogenase [Actinomadura viridis]|uniref:Shikimate dehydrogenase n=1 Tax=Actinomadura viridis TaxID=58110 RepID=A0A931DCB2_9ACTN|nr:shikimate dehydrogenase [Actinomadura viridis]MBG6085963.1 shikimate dehydrogenase [Actinomadura viridis]